MLNKKVRNSKEYKNLLKAELSIFFKLGKSMKRNTFIMRSI